MTSRSNLVKYRHVEGSRVVEVPYLYVDKITGTFYCRKRVKKHVFTRSLETDSFRVAKYKVVDVSRELENEKPRMKSQLLVKDYYLRLYDNKVTHGIKKTTLSRFEVAWRLSIEPFFGNLNSSDIHPNIVTDFIKWHQRKRPGVQFYNVFKYLGNIFSFMEKQGVLHKSQIPTLKLPNAEQIHHSEQKGTYIEKEEIELILKKCGLRAALFVEFGYAYGMRIGEIAGLRIDQIDLKEGVLSLSASETKTKYGRKIPLMPNQIELIKSQIKFGTRWLFPMKSDNSRHIPTQIPDREFRNAVKDAKIKRRINFHSLRHSAASNFAKANVNPSVACTILGMSLRTYQQKYLKLTADDLRLAIEAVSTKRGRK